MAASEARAYRFEDISRHSKLLLALLAFGGILAVVAVISGWMQRNVLFAIEAGNFATDQEMQEAATASDNREGVVGILQFGTAIATMVTFAWWIVRSSRNTHALSATPLKFSPGWSLGWFFVPVANIWKPFQAMRQTWNVSEDPAGDSERPASGLMWVWWLLCLFSSSVDRAAFRQMMKAEELPQLIKANFVMLLSDALSLPLAIAAGLLVWKIMRMQAAAGDKQTPIPVQ